MTDLSRIIADLCAGLGDDNDPSISGFPETVSGGANQQDIDIASSFRLFRCFQSEDDPHRSNSSNRHENIDFVPAEHARASPYVSEAETPETPETRGYPLLAEDLSFFPVKDSEPERPEREEPVAGVFPLLEDPLPISPSDVRAGVARELRSLAEDGREGPGALRDAVEITRAKIRNSEALAERQAHGGRCHVCDEPLDDSAPVVAVLSGKRGAPLHMHAGCCPAYTARRVALVDKIMVAAGYGAEAEGAAA